MRRVLVPLAVVLVLVLALAGAGAWWVAGQVNAPGPLTAPKVVVVPKGVGLSAIGRQLAQAGVLNDPRLFALAARFQGRPLQAGEYRFDAQVSLAGVVALLQSGRTEVHKFTLPEGLTSRQALDLLAKAAGMDGDAGPVPPDGSLLPETYLYSYGETRAAMVARMQKDMSALLARLWAARQPGLPLKTPEQAVILASIVERETALPEERPHVAAVFENRLRLGMRLQSDPTVIYGLSHGLGELGRPLTSADLTAANPYSTYLHAGLPPGPICNPGAASLAAVLHPRLSQDLYFVADGSGGHAFARTLAQHDRNVEKWRQVEHSRATASTHAAATEGAAKP